MSEMRIVTILVFAAACGGGRAKSDQTMPTPHQPVDPIPSTSGPACGVVADKLAPVASADEPDAPDAQDKVHAQVKARCTDDKWADDARSCFATVETDAEIDGCLTKLSDDQRPAAAKALGKSAAEAEAAPQSAPKPPPAPGGSKGGKGTRGAVQRNSSDPEEGGEAKGSDPQEGGEKR
jgi:hypothetical protein